MAGADHQSAPVDDRTLSNLMQRYEDIKVFDAHKNALIEVRALVSLYNTTD